MGRTGTFSNRFLLASSLLGLIVLFDVVLFGWLLLRSLSQREISRVLLEAREEVEGLARQLAGQARQQGEDLYLAIATERETRTYIDSVLRQRDFVRTVEIRDRDGKLVYLIKTTAQGPEQGGEALTLGSPEVPPRYEQEEVERQQSFDVYDLTVPIEDLGQIRLGISREELERRVQVLREDLLGQAGAVGIVTLALLVSGYLIIWWLLRRSQRLEEQAADAERLAYIGTLAAGLAHEIRNPLNSLSLNMQMLEEELRGECAPRATKRLLAITRSEIGRLERLVIDFLAYARPRPLERQRVPAVSLLTRVREVLASQFQTRGIEARIEDASDGACVDVDPAQLNQLLLNLAQNAMNAGEDCGKPLSLDLRATVDGSRVVLEVEDDGPGIPAPELGRIFDLFYSTRKGGTGLGLAIAQRIARAHGGELEVDSAVGRGTRMRLALPVAGPLTAQGLPASVGVSQTSDLASEGAPAGRPRQGFLPDL